MIQLIRGFKDILPGEVELWQEIERVVRGLFKDFGFSEIRIPIITVNGDLWPINYEANRRHMFSFDAIVLKETDHFLMLNRAEEFNEALEKAIDTVLQKRVKQKHIKIRNHKKRCLYD